MNTIDAAYILHAFIAADVPVVLWGDRGVGKSSIVRQVAKELGIPYIDLRLATQEVSDLIGIPTVGIDPTSGKKKTYWARPEWFPGDDTPKGILFLDEMNRAPRDVTQATFQLVLDKRLHTHVLPPGWRIVAACNYFGSYDVRELDEAMMSRFAHIDVEASHHAVCDYALEVGWESRVINFLRSNPKMLISTHEDKGETAPQKYSPSPDPRRWEMVNRMMVDGVKAFPGSSEDHLIRQALTCIVGEAAARTFLQFREKLPTFEDILTGKSNYEKIVKETKENALMTGIEKICMEAVTIIRLRDYDVKEFNRAAKFFIEIERKDLIAGCLQRLLELRDEKKLKDDEWVNQLVSNAQILALFEDMLKKKKII